jgi:3-methyladenine DNA glycosylase AlkD
MSGPITLNVVRAALEQAADESRIPQLRRFFKTEPGQYGAGDRFLGIRVPDIRRVARMLQDAPADVTLALLRSPYHEERLTALVGLVETYRRGSPDQREEIYKFYMANREHVNSWDLVDSSAPYIVGPHLPLSNTDVLVELARSTNVWDRRIAVLATFHDIRRGEMGRFLRIANLLLRDREDLIHKSVGWMLREMGKRKPRLLNEFLDEHAEDMPRTMLRYAIEKLSADRRKMYMEAGRSR